MSFGGQTVTLRSQANGDTVWSGVLMQPYSGKDVGAAELARPYLGPEIAELAGQLINFNVETWLIVGPPISAARSAVTAVDLVVAGGVSYPIQRVEPFSDFTDVHHVEITCCEQVDPAVILEAVLALRGQEIILTPATGVATEKPSGGFDYADAAPRDPQTFVVYKAAGLDGREKSQTDQGLSRKFQFMLVGAGDSDIALGDKWSDSGANFEVHSIDRTRPYMVQAHVVGFLKETGHGYGA